MKKNKDKHNIIFSGKAVPVFFSAVFLFFAYGINYSDAAKFKYGVSLRENALLMKAPDGIDKTLMPDRAIALSQTSMRLYNNISAGKISFSFAVETKENFYSTRNKLFNFFNSSSGVFGGGKPIERFDASFEHISESSVNLRTRLERFDVAWSIGSYDFAVGRQPVSLGTSHFIGILDVVAPFAPGALDATYKPGVDAVRIRHGLGVSGEAELIAAGGKPWCYGALIGRLRTSVKGMDVELNGGRFRNRGYGGLAWEGGIGDIGVWGELAVFQRKNNKEKFYGGWTEAAFSGVAGIDVNLPAEFKAGGGLMFQDFGVRNPKDLRTVYIDAPFREGWLFLASSLYGLITIHRQMHPLVNFDVAGLINLVDSSTLWQPMISVSAGNNADLNFYGWIGTGRKNEVDFFKYTTRSEFGSFPGGAGFYARWFF